MLTSARLRALRDGLGVAGLLFAAYLFFVVAPAAGTFGFDAAAYWAVDLADPYERLAGRFGAFPYTPVAAIAFEPVGIVPWWVFLWLWEALLVGTLVWLGGRRSLLLLAFPPVALELYHGNVHLLIAAAIALGRRHPWLWAVPLLTKVTPAVGLVWFAVRREWRELAIAVGTAAALVAASLLFSLALGRDLWGEWLASVGATAAGAPLGQVSIAIPLAVRLPAAVALVAWGARSDRSWTLAVGATLALPVLWPSGLAVLAALWKGPWSDGSTPDLSTGRSSSSSASSGSSRSPT